MAYTVWSAFDTYREEVVDLVTYRTELARSSRDYLKTQINQLADITPFFPKTQKKFIDFGSFARRTKIRPLDDIDMLMLLNAGGTTSVHLHADAYGLRLDNSAASLAPYANHNGFIDSNRVLNQIRSSLGSITNYSKAEIKRSGEAVVLNLSSYEWAFDVVPAAPINDHEGGTAYYLIPNGVGNWKRTDPRIDARHITAVNQAHNGQFLPLIRLIKQWRRTFDCPSISSYYLETLAWMAFKDSTSDLDFPDLLRFFFETAKNYVFRPCPDPKGLGPALDSAVTLEDKIGFYIDFYLAAKWSATAIERDANGDTSGALFYWGLVFGDEFPTYG
ncbi:hypothetical protein D3C72_535030 [compost metagenome]